MCLATSARVMLTSNLWVDVGLINGAVQAICYITGGPPDLPIAVMVRFDSYSGPTFPDGTVPITPLCRCWSSSGGQCSRLQLSLKLAWAVTIHKSQGLTVVVDTPPDNSVSVETEADADGCAERDSHTSPAADACPGARVVPHGGVEGQVPDSSSHLTPQSLTREASPELLTDEGVVTLGAPVMQGMTHTHPPRQKRPPKASHRGYRLRSKTHPPARLIRV